MKKFEPLVLLVILSLLINIYAVSRIGSLQSTIDQLRSTVMSQSSQGQLQSQISNLSNQIARMESESRWIVRHGIKPVLEGSTRENTYLSIDWVMREVKEGSQVSMLYRAYDTDTWLRAKDIDKDQNSFAAVIEVQPNVAYQYRFEERTSTSTQTSEIYTINKWWHSPPSYILHANTHGPAKKGYSLFSFTMFAQEKSSFDFYQVQEIKVNYYADGVQVKSEVLEGEHPENYVYAKQLEIPSHIDTVKLEAVFGDGYKLEETIWPVSGQNGFIDERLIFGR